MTALVVEDAKRLVRTAGCGQDDDDDDDGMMGDCLFGVFCLVRFMFLVITMVVFSNLSFHFSLQSTLITSLYYQLFCHKKGVFVVESVAFSLMCKDATAIIRLIRFDSSFYCVVLGIVHLTCSRVL